LVAIDADDEGLLLGRSAFETLRTYGGRLFGLEAHLDRLTSSCAALGIECPPLQTVEAELMEAAEMVPGEAMVRVTITASSTRVVRAVDLPGVPDPFRCVSREYTPPAWLDGTVKHASRAASRAAVLSAGVEEVIWTDSEGFMLEGTRSNLFAVISGVLVTPPVDGRLLAGVTREAMIDAADTAGVAVRIEGLSIDGAYDELYVCSTLKELTPIDELNGRPAPGAGPVGDSVLAAFREQAAGD
jgi:branched-chain amino acid aminotransferase